MNLQSNTLDINNNFNELIKVIKYLLKRLLKYNISSGNEQYNE